MKNGLVDAITTVLGDESIKRNLVENAQEFIKLNSWENIADQYLKILGDA